MAVCFLHLSSSPWGCGRSRSANLHRRVIFSGKSSTVTDKAILVLITTDADGLLLHSSTWNFGPAFHGRLACRAPGHLKCNCTLETDRPRLAHRRLCGVAQGFPMGLCGTTRPRNKPFSMTIQRREVARLMKERDSSRPRNSGSLKIHGLFLKLLSSEIREIHSPGLLQQHRTEDPP